MEKEFYIDYEGTVIIKAKNKKEAREKFWELEFMGERANVICGIEEKKPKKYLIDKKGLTK